MSDEPFILNLHSLIYILSALLTGYYYEIRALCALLRAL